MDQHHYYNWADPEFLQSCLYRSGRTQKDLALALGVAPSAISRLLSGRRGLKASEIPRLTEFFDFYLRRDQGGKEPSNFRHGGWRPVQKGMAQRLRTVFHLLEVDSESVAALMRIEVARISGMLNEQGPFPDLSVWDGLARTLGFPFDWLLYGGQGSVRPTSSNHLSGEILLPDSIENGGQNGNGPETSEMPGSQTRLPVYERYTSLEGPTKRFEWKPAGEHQVPQPLMGIRQAFGIYAGDDAMAPRHMFGEVLYCNPLRPPSVGQVAIATLHSAEKTIIVGAVTERTVERVVISSSLADNSTASSVAIDLADIDILGSVVATSVA